MAWCPKCRNEYREGITQCADCMIDLVEELPKKNYEEVPVVLYETEEEAFAQKIVIYLNYCGIRTAGILPTEDKFNVAVARFEQEAAEEKLAEVTANTDDGTPDLDALVSNIGEELKEIEDEKAKEEFAEMRSESSSVYVKQKDKYNDLKFSGISFLVFAAIGLGFLLLNAFEVFTMFKGFSLYVLGAVFVIFIAIGISSLLRANKLKNMVSEEEKKSDEVLDWIDKNITDDVIANLSDAEASVEDNYFTVHSELCKMVSEQFPFFSKSYIEQLMDDRYNDYCEK